LANEFSLTPDDVSDIVAIIAASGYDRLEVSTTRFRLVLSRQHESWTQEWTWSEESAVPSAIPPAATPPPVAAPEHAGLTPVPAPLPGTFYRSPQPGAPPYVSEGDSVQEGTILGIIETMKLMSTVTSSGRGTIAQILVANGTPIDAQTTLMLIKPDPA
jgi:acetyl-CoA carboxylase biotin carboxyl carrier protein